MRKGSFLFRYGWWRGRKDLVPAAAGHFPQVIIFRLREMILFPIAMAHFCQAKTQFG